MAIVIIALVGFLWPIGYSSSDNCWLLLAGTFVFGLCVFRTKATRAIIGIIYGLFALQVTLFTVIVARSQVIWLFLLAATLAFFCIAYLFYGPLKQLLRNPRA